MSQHKKGIAVGTDDYSKIIDLDCYFVDKTPLIKSLFEQNKSEVILITRPRRFGKTLTMSMFYHFLSINHKAPLDLSRHQELFKDQAIMREQEFCHHFMGQYPVIYISLKEIDGLSFENAYLGLAQSIYKLATNFSFLLESDKLNELKKNDFKNLIDPKVLNLAPNPLSITILKSSLLTLTELLYKHTQKKSIILIDEYDVPLAKASQHGYYEQMIDLIRGLLSSVLKSNPYLEKAILTGCLRIAKESIFTGLNNISVNTVLSRADSMSKGIGFTKQETFDMLKYYELSAFNAQVQEWYDGYNLANNEMFCAWDVVKFCSEAMQLEDPKNMLPQNYWINTSSNELISQFLGFLTEKDAEELQVLVDGGFISKKIQETLSYEDLIKHRSNDFWSMLVYTGYLTVAENSNFDLAGSELKLKIPNKSVRLCFIEKIQSYFTEEPTQILKASRILQCIFDADPKNLRLAINEALSRFISLRDFSTKSSKEYYYHGFLNGVFSTQSDHLKDYASNQESGDGYSDISFLSKDSLHGIILELKYTDDQNKLIKTSDTALNQIDLKNYIEQFKLNGFTERVYAYGISFCKKQCAVSFKEYLIE